MRHVLLGLFLSFGLLATGFSNGGFYDSYALVNGGFYDLGASTANTDFNGAPLGNFDISTGSLFLGGQSKTFKNDGTDVTGVSIFYRFYQGTATGSYSEINYDFQWNRGEIGAPGNLNNPGDQQWGTDIQGANTTNDAIDILNGATLTTGTYTLEVYVRVTTNGVNSLSEIFDNNGGANYLATFVITSAMPVNFGMLDVEKHNQTHLLSFTTATETNNAYFDIERSTDSRHWEKLGSIAGAGTTQQEQQYRFVDENPLPGLNYYRVKQVDFDGSFSYSAIVSARWEGKIQVHLFPNPADDLLQISGLPTTDGPITIEIIDMAGRVILQQTWSQSAIDVAQLADGVYSLRISSSSGLIDNQRLFIH